MSAPPGTGITVDDDVPVRMSDGAVLYADVYRPSRGGPFPALLIRTPYGKRWLQWFMSVGFDPLAMTRAGYAVVLQDVRGTGTSQGTFRLFLDEGPDGAETVAWVATQPWCDGAVGMAGMSYPGGGQVLAAQERPPALRAIAPFVAGYAMEAVYVGGAFQLDLHATGSAMLGLAQLARREAAGEDVTAARERLAAIMVDPTEVYRRLPLLDWATFTPWIDDNYGEWLRKPEGGHPWDAKPGSERWTFTTPTLLIAGWHDLFLKDSLDMFRSLRAAAPSEDVRSRHRLVLAPSGHGPTSPTVGDLWVGPATAFDLQAAYLEWFGAWLKGEPLPEREPVTLFVHGVNRWRDEPDWPLARAVPTRWYLRAGGTLSLAAPGDEDPDTFVYDPREPVPTISGQSLVSGRDGFSTGALRDRRRVHGRPDVLLYVSDVLQHDVEVTGAVRATLYVATSARDTDFTAVLIDVHPDGRAIGLTDGILRLRYRDGMRRPQLLEPGRVYEIQVDLVATSNVFFAGHRIALEISSSNFPRFDRNPNHGGVIAGATESDFVVATQRVFHDWGRASYITLPSVPA